jgi:hypothetical protein
MPGSFPVLIGRGAAGGLTRSIAGVRVDDVRLAIEQRKAVPMCEPLNSLY